MTDDQRYYEESRCYPREDVQKALEVDDADQLSRLVIGEALHESDLDFAESLCLRLAVHVDPVVRGNAVLGFGHLARRFGSLKSPIARSLIESALNDESEYVRGQAWAAADDVVHFLGWNIRGFSDQE